GVLARQLPLTGVVAAALRTEDQEPTQPCPVVDRPGETAGAVRDLGRAGDRRRLRRTPLALALQVGHPCTSLRGRVGGCCGRGTQTDWSTRLLLLLFQLSYRHAWSACRAGVEPATVRSQRTVLLRPAARTRSCERIPVFDRPGRLPVTAHREPASSGPRTKT